MKVIRKVTSGELLAKQTMREQIYYIQKSTYTLKLLLNVVTAGTEALVSGKKFCMPVSEKYAACELSHILIPSTNSSLLLKSCDPSHFFR
jgi:hypothetical protein